MKKNYVTLTNKGTPVQTTHNPQVPLTESSFHDLSNLIEVKAVPQSKTALAKIILKKYESCQI